MLNCACLCCAALSSGGRVSSKSKHFTAASLSTQKGTVKIIFTQLNFNLQSRTIKTLNTGHTYDTSYENLVTVFKKVKKNSNFDPDNFAGSVTKNLLDSDPNAHFMLIDLASTNKGLSRSA
jgi:hypothetical protein